MCAGARGAAPAASSPRKGASLGGNEAHPSGSGSPRVAWGLGVRLHPRAPGGLDSISTPRKLPLLLLLKTDLITDQRREDASTRQATTHHFNDGP